ncbi:unnamed protein product [Meganyctiphanes norvegica]|uniref:Uncharacterized protein n=1 Tax=Meganyctiphanes norvegica TaxID=48144 RepID=A0AAV2RP08_MEGNR
MDAKSSDAGGNHSQTQSKVGFDTGSSILLSKGNGQQNQIDTVMQCKSTDDRTSRFSTPESLSSLNPETSHDHRPPILMVKNPILNDGTGLLVHSQGQTTSVTTVRAPMSSGTIFMLPVRIPVSTSSSGIAVRPVVSACLPVIPLTSMEPGKVPVLKIIPTIPSTNSNIPIIVRPQLVIGGSVPVIEACNLTTIPSVNELSSNVDKDLSSGAKIGLTIVPQNSTNKLSGENYSLGGPTVSTSLPRKARMSIIPIIPPYESNVVTSSVFNAEESIIVSSSATVNDSSAGSSLSSLENFTKTSESDLPENICAQSFTSSARDGIDEMNSKKYEVVNNLEDSSTHSLCSDEPLLQIKSVSLINESIPSVMLPVTGVDSGKNIQHIPSNIIPSNTLDQNRNRNQTIVTKPLVSCVEARKELTSVISIKDRQHCNPTLPTENNGGAIDLTFRSKSSSELNESMYKTNYLNLNREKCIEEPINYTMKKIESKAEFTSETKFHIPMKSVAQINSVIKPDITIKQELNHKALVRSSSMDDKNYKNHQKLNKSSFYKKQDSGMFNLVRSLSDGKLNAIHHSTNKSDEKKEVECQFQLTSPLDKKKELVKGAEISSTIKQEYSKKNVLSIYPSDKQVFELQLSAQHLPERKNYQQALTLLKSSVEEKQEIKREVSDSHLPHNKYLDMVYPTDLTKRGGFSLDSANLNKTMSNSSECFKPTATLKTYKSSKINNSVTDSSHRYNKSSASSSKACYSSPKSVQTPTKNVHTYASIVNLSKNSTLSSISSTTACFPSSSSVQTLSKKIHNDTSVLDLSIRTNVSSVFSKKSCASSTKSVQTPPKTNHDYASIADLSTSASLSSVTCTKARYSYPSSVQTFPKTIHNYASIADLSISDSLSSDTSAKACYSNPASVQTIPKTIHNNVRIANLPICGNLSNGTKPTSDHKSKNISVMHPYITIFGANESCNVSEDIT